MCMCVLEYMYSTPYVYKYLQRPHTCRSHLGLEFQAVLSHLISVLVLRAEPVSSEDG